MITLPLIAEDIGTNTPWIVMTAMLGFIGASIGFMTFWLTKNKSKTIKIATLVSMVLALIATIYFFTSQNDSIKRNLISCAICGYKGIEIKGEECEVCFATINEAYRLEQEYTSLEDLIQKEQAVFFASEKELTFYAPKVYQDGPLKYVKDENWTPRIEIEAVIEMRKVIETASE